LLDLSGKIDPLLIEIFDAIAGVVVARDIHYFVVGATARDMILSYGHDIEIKRATVDIDLGVEVADWDEFHALKNGLAATGRLNPLSQRKDCCTSVICRSISCRLDLWSMPTRK